MENFYQRIHDVGILPVIRLEDAQKAVRLAHALIEGGIPAAEITFRTEAALPAIEAIAKACPELLLGAGTVRAETQARQAADAGAMFLVAPGSNPEVMRLAKDLCIPMLPGAVTATELEIGLALGYGTFKFFPADSYGGLKTINALSAPYQEVWFVPTGGVDLSNLGEYLKNRHVMAVGGSFIAPAKLIDEENYSAIMALGKAAASIRQQVRA